jgi:hypothetical protein
MIASGVFFEAGATSSSVISTLSVHIAETSHHFILGGTGCLQPVRRSRQRPFKIKLGFPLVASRHWLQATSATQLKRESVLGYMAKFNRGPTTTPAGKAAENQET